jgi:hypothetical protein
MISLFLQDFNMSHINQHRACKNVGSEVTILMLKTILPDLTVSSNNIYKTSIFGIVPRDFLLSTVCHQKTHQTSESCPRTISTLASKSLRYSIRGSFCSLSLTPKSDPTMWPGMCSPPPNLSCTEASPLQHA